MRYISYYLVLTRVPGLDMAVGVSVYVRGGWVLTESVRQAKRTAGALATSAPSVQHAHTSMLNLRSLGNLISIVYATLVAVCTAGQKLCLHSSEM